MYSQDDLLPISALQHLIFCERQAALIHIERLWAENVLTVEGHEIHERAHSQESGTSGDTYTVRSLQIRSLKLGLVGVTDVVEFHETDTRENSVSLENKPGFWKPSIVEYKHGQPKIDRCDEVQLCAQAMCLEEILGIKISESEFFYGRPRRREKVILDDSLRQETIEAAERLHRLVKAGKTPEADYTPKCRACSLLDLCLPKASGSQGKVRRYVKAMTDMENNETST